MITSNIQGVMRRLQSHQLGVEKAVKSAFDRERWWLPLLHVAERTMKALAEGDEAKFIPLFLATLEVALLNRGWGMRASLGTPGESSGMVGRVVQRWEDAFYHTGQDGERRKRRQPVLLQPFEERDMSQVKAGLLRWVAEEKRKDERDAGLSDEEIAQRLGEILFEANPSDKQREARASLIPAIQAFMQQIDPKTAGLPAATVSRWLRAVLLAWRETVREQIVAGMPGALAKMRRGYLEKLM